MNNKLEPVRVTRQRFTRASAVGTSYKGTITATRAQLAEVFGEGAYVANDGDNKIQWHWTLELSAPGFGRTIVTIYDYKTGRDIDADEMFEWHVGGKGPDTTTWLELAIRGTVLDTGYNAKTDYTDKAGK